MEDLEREIENLNEIIEKIKWKSKDRRIEILLKENQTLRENNQTLQLWLDNKEKLNEEYRKQIDMLRMRKEELDENCYWLAKENEKLKSDLWECECSFWFEADECWYWKREYKRLKQWIKEHCKWYWNLFPEDEMKSQWKKADKKRKKEEIRVARDEHSMDIWEITSIKDWTITWKKDSLWRWYSEWEPPIVLC